MNVRGFSFLSKGPFLWIFGVTYSTLQHKWSTCQGLSPSSLMSPSPGQEDYLGSQRPQRRSLGTTVNNLPTLQTRKEDRDLRPWWGRDGKKISCSLPRLSRSSTFWWLHKISIPQIWCVEGLQHSKGGLMDAEGEDEQRMKKRRGKNEKAVCEFKQNMFCWDWIPSGFWRAQADVLTKASRLKIHHYNLLYPVCNLYLTGDMWDCALPTPPFRFEPSLGGGPARDLCF